MEAARSFYHQKIVNIWSKLDEKAFSTMSHNSFEGKLHRMHIRASHFLNVYQICLTLGAEPVPWWGLYGTGELPISCPSLPALRSCFIQHRNMHVRIFDTCAGTWNVGVISGASFRRRWNFWIVYHTLQYLRDVAYDIHTLRSEDTYYADLLQYRGEVYR